MAKLRIQRELKHRVPHATDETHEMGFKVLANREEVVAGRIEEWFGPYLFIGD